MAIHELFFLAEMRTVNVEGGGMVETIVNVVRSYESSQRASEDVDLLLKSTHPESRYRVFTVEHIDA